MKKNKIGIFLVVLGAFLIISALGWLFYNLYLSLNAEKVSSELVEELYPYCVNNDLSKSSDTGDGSNSELALIKSGDFECIGILEIPDLELVLPISSSYDLDVMKSIPCRYSGSPYSDDFVIAGHHYPGLFGKLLDIKTGTLIRFYDFSGEIFTYEVDAVDALYPSDVDQMINSDWDLTLFTCDLSVNYRMAIRCNIKK